ncbi:MAG: hypothetical protein CL853_05825 [Crocinitomicaceae bacterium]|nr:hypothetical protein [Crocinitomicaceae bacterium]|tara:strand:+ start:4168 stop:5511 length:1344 start_codon:yes stop_codon:yes gene_type:complete
MQSIDDILGLHDVFISIVYLIIIFSIAFIVKNRYSNLKRYKYLAWGLLFKIIGVISFCFIYLFYYKGGDTISYFQGAKALADLFKINFNYFYDVVFLNKLDWNHYMAFNSETWYPPFYMWNDKNTFSVCRFSSFFSLITFNSFFATSILVATFSFFGIWKIFSLFDSLFPNNSLMLAILILFMPSLIFWGSGIMKDSYVLSSTCWATYNFHKIFIERKKIFINVIILILNILIVINTKSYVLVCLLPGMLLWLNSAYLKNTRSVLKKIILFPIIFSSIVLVGYFLFSNLSSSMGVYGDVDSVVKKVQVTQKDLLREDQYGGNNYNIGEIDGTISGLISIAPKAIFTAIFRPLFWEVGSPVMIISVIENTLLLLMTIYLFIRVGPFKLIRVIISEPLLLYSLIFSILFAFGVGIAGTNFGALVRYKTPLMPFFFTMIYLIYSKDKNIS